MNAAHGGILVVDDDSALRHALGAVLHRKVGPADGLEFLSQLRCIQPRCLRVPMSGVLDLPVVMRAINHGDVSRVVDRFDSTRS